MIRPDGRDGKSNGVAANHPLTMLDELAAKGMPQRFRQSDQEESSKQGDRRFLVDSGRWFFRMPWSAPVTPTIALAVRKIRPDQR